MQVRHHLRNFSYNINNMLARFAQCRNIATWRQIRHYCRLLRQLLCKNKEKNGTDKIALRAHAPTLFRGHVGRCSTMHKDLRLFNRKRRFHCLLTPCNAFNLCNVIIPRVTSNSFRLLSISLFIFCSHCPPVNITLNNHFLI